MVYADVESHSSFPELHYQKLVSVLKTKPNGMPLPDSPISITESGCAVLDQERRERLHFAVPVAISIVALVVSIIALIAPWLVK